jgi:hypothetical protein
MFFKRWGLRGFGGDPPERDLHLEAALQSLDPAVKRPQYWVNFQRAALLAAGPELGRRRRLAEVTMSEIMFSWSRALVPAAMVAAAAALFLAERADTAAVSPLRLEQILWEGVDVAAGDPRPQLEVEISFAAEIF